MLFGLLKPVTIEITISPIDLFNKGIIVLILMLYSIWKLWNI